MEAAPLKRHHQSEKSLAKRLPCRHSQPALDKTARRHLRRVVGIRAEDKRRGLFKSARAKNKGWFIRAGFDSPPFSAPITKRKREIGFLFLSPRNFNSWTRVQSSSPLFRPQLSIPRFQYRGFATFLRIDSASVFFRVDIKRRDICRGFWLERSCKGWFLSFLFWKQASFGISNFDWKSY